MREHPRAIVSFALFFCTSDRAASDTYRQVYTKIKIYSKQIKFIWGESISLLRYELDRVLLKSNELI